MDKTTLKSWFEQGKKPTAEQFAAWIDSYWHKDEKVGIPDIDGLFDELFDKATKEELDARVMRLQEILFDQTNAINGRIGEMKEIYSSDSGRPSIRNGEDGREVMTVNHDDDLQLMHADGGKRSAVRVKHDGVVELTSADILADDVEEGGKITLRPPTVSENETTEYNPQVEITTTDDWHLNMGPEEGVRLGRNDRYVQIDPNEERAELRYLDGEVRVSDNEVKIAFSNATRFSLKKEGDLKLLNNEGRNVLLADSRRMILYHPNGTQFIHSNPDKVAKDGSEADDRFTIRYPNGAILLEASREPDLNDGSADNYRVVLKHELDGVENKFMGLQSLITELQEEVSELQSRIEALEG